MPLLEMLQLHELKYLWVICPHALFVSFGLHMTSVPSFQTCYDNVVVLHLLKLFQNSILSCWFSLIHEPYAYDALMLFSLCYVYFDFVPLVAMYSCCSIFVSCLQHAIILTLLMYMSLCYKVAFCIDHIGLILMPMNLNLNLNDIWSMLCVHEVHV